MQPLLAAMWPLPVTGGQDTASPAGRAGSRRGLTGAGRWGGAEDGGARRQQDGCSEVVGVCEAMKPRREETEDRGEVGEVLGLSFCQTPRTFIPSVSFHVYVSQPSGGSALQDKLGGGCQPW